MNMMVIDRDSPLVAGLFPGASQPNGTPVGAAADAEPRDADETPMEDAPAATAAEPASPGPADATVIADVAAQDAATTAETPEPRGAAGDIAYDPMTGEPPAARGGPSAKAQAAFDFKLGVRMEMSTTPHGLELAIELPGVQARDIDIEARAGMLTVRGELRRDTDRADRTCRMSDRNYGKFSRSIELPRGVRPDLIKASLDCGLLSIFIPNPVSPASTRIHIQSPLTYLSVAEDTLQLALAAPGLGEDDLDVEVSGGVLTIRGRAPSPPPSDALAARGKDVTLFRAIELPADAQADQISASLARGVLNVVVPIRSGQDPQRVRVQAA